MESVEITAGSVKEALEQGLRQLGVAEEDCEYEVVKESGFIKKKYTVKVTEKPKGRVLLLAVLYLLLAVLVILNAVDQDYGTGLMVFSGCIAAIGVYFSVLHFVGLAKISQNENKKTGRK